MAAPAPRKAQRVFIETHGCTTNIGDSQIMAGILQAAGHTLVEREEDADLLVLNTCTVVQTTDQRLLHRLRTWRENGKPVIAAGCMAAAQPALVQAAHPRARLLPPRLLDQVAEVAAGAPLVDRENPKAGLPRATGTHAVIPLAEGCLFSCTYCLTKHARGDQRSHPPHLLVADIRDAIHRGAAEVRLTAQDTSGYGSDIGTDLPSLLRAITAIGGDFRVRLGMMHPATAHRIIDPLLDAMDHPKVYRFLHLPIQTGSTRMLRAMGRGHALDAFHAVVDAFRTRFPKGVLSTDIIVGFPGETPADHAATLRLLHELAPEHVNITRWSPRPGTAASSLQGRLPTHIMKRRSRQATHHVMGIWAARNPLRVGEALEVVITEPAKKPGTAMGRGPAYEPIVVPDAGHLPRPCLLPVRVTGARTTYLLAVPTGAALPLGKPQSAARLPALPVLQ